MTSRQGSASSPAHPGDPGGYAQAITPREGDCALRTEEAIRLLEPAVPPGPATWADLGAGTGTLTRALARLLGSGSRIVTVDSSPRAVTALRRWTERGTGGGERHGAPGLVPHGAPGEAPPRAQGERRAPGEALVLPALGDFRSLDAVPELAGILLDGILFANALHFVADGVAVLTDVRERLRDEGRVVVVEYEGRRPSRWVPHPISFRRLEELALGAGFQPPVVVGRRASDYGGEIYCAVLGRPR